VSFRGYGQTRTNVALGRTVEALVKTDRGISLGDGRLTVARYWADWLESVKPTVKAKTFHSPAQVVRTHVLPPVKEGGLGSIKLSKLSKADIEAFMRGRANAGGSPRTCQYILALLRMGLRRAVEAELIGRNVGRLGTLHQRF
jgi:hypothetical protein